METVTLKSEQEPTDGMLKRLFWPTIGNQHDVRLVGVQGFWVCTAVALLSMAYLVSTGNWLAGITIAITYTLGGIGVRERNVAAAVLVFACFFLVRMLSLETRALNGVGAGASLFWLVALVLLAANVRATLLAHSWAQSSDWGYDADASTLPARVWPVGRYVFFSLAGLLLALTVFIMVMTPSGAKQIKHLVQQQDQTQF